VNSKELYLNICQIISLDGMTWPQESEYNREAVVHVSRSSNNKSISHITLEFSGVRAKFFCCILFDGSGDYGVGVHSFAMPKLKLTLPQKALASLSILKFLIDSRRLDANFEFYRERICTDLNGGVGDTLIRFDALCMKSAQYLEHKEKGRPPITKETYHASV
jgi:hypothetical protein